MLFAVDLECRRALQIRPFRGYDADATDARAGATRNEAKFKQDAKCPRRGLRGERVRAGSGEGPAELRAGQPTAAAEGTEDARDGLAGRGLAGEHAAGEVVLGGGEQGVEEAAGRGSWRLGAPVPPSVRQVGGRDG